MSRQRTLADPLLDLRLFKVGAFTAALSILMVSMLATGWRLPLHLRLPPDGRGTFAHAGGLWMVPSAIASILAAQLAPILAKRHAPGTVIGVGLLVGTIGYLMLVLVDPVGGLPLLMAAFVIIFIGVGTLGALGTSLVVGSVAAGARRLRGGSVLHLRRPGNALGVATLGSLGAAVFRDSLDLPRRHPPGAAAAATQAWKTPSPRPGTCPPTPPRTCWPPPRRAYTKQPERLGVACAIITATSAALALAMPRKNRDVTPSDNALSST